MANTYVNPTIVAKEALRQLKNNCVAGKLVHRGYEDEWRNIKVNGWKKGDTITLKTPMYSRVQDGDAIKVVDLLEQSTTFQLSYHKHVAYKVSTKDQTLSIDAFNERYTKPAAIALANFIDTTVYSDAYKYIPNQVGSPGSTPKDFLTYALADAVLTDQAVPQDSRSCVINPITKAYLADTLKNLYNPSQVNNLIERSKFGMVSNFETYVSQNLPTHTPGTAAGLTTILVDETPAEEDTTITLDQNGSWAVTLTAGDIFTIGTCNAVNPISGADLGYLRQFVNTAAVAASGSEQACTTIPGLAPWNIRSKAASDKTLPYQNIDTLFANNDAVSVVGTASTPYKINLAFHKDCISLACVPFAMPESATWKAQESEDGYSITVIRAYDITNYTEYIRFDVLFGVKVINPFFGCRIAG